MRSLMFYPLESERKNSEVPGLVQVRKRMKVRGVMMVQYKQVNTPLGGRATKNPMSIIP